MDRNDDLKEILERLKSLEERISKLEDFSDIISADLFDLQSNALNNIHIEDMPEAFPSDDDVAKLFREVYYGDDDDDCDCEDCDDCDCEDDDCDCEDCHHHDHHRHDEDYDDDDEDYSAFVRCPYCNTLIFAKKGDETFSCPFCNEKFSRQDV